MTDIVERLCTPHRYDLMDEAADEIERLRAALQKIADLNDSEADEPLDDAIAIARAALKESKS